MSGEGNVRDADPDVDAGPTVDASSASLADSARPAEPTDDASPIEVMLVGPAGHSTDDPATGGILRYMAEQPRRLPSSVTTRTYDVAYPEGSGPRWFLSCFLLALLRMLRFPFRSRPDLVHVHTSHDLSFYQSAFYVLFSALIWRRPVVVHVHGSSFDEFVAEASPPVRLLQAVVFRASDAVVALSAYWKETLSARVRPEKIVVLPNAVEPDDYDPSFEADPPHVVFVSNHIRRKGIAEFVEAVDRLLTDGDSPFRVTIAGSGPLADRSRELADRHPEVEYRGYVPEAEKRALLDEGSIYALPTYAEGLPIALLEGMAGGNAVISTDVGSIPEVVDEENGIVIPPGDTDALVAALRGLVADSDATVAMARANAALVDSRYNWDHVATRLTGLYRLLLDDETSRSPADESSGREDDRPSEENRDARVANWT